MYLDWLTEVVTHEGEVASVHVDATRAEARGEHDERLHRRVLLERLREYGAPPAVVDVVGERVANPTQKGGEQGRHVVVADSGEVLLDVVVAGRPERDEVSWSSVPCLLPLLRALDPAVAHLVVEADRAGADVTVVDALGRQVRSDGVEGGHDELTKVRGGTESHRRIQSRVEDSWERNADAVVAHVRRLVDAHDPEVVLLTGDPHACGLVRDGLEGSLGDRLRWVRAGGRADGVDRDAMHAEVDEVLREVRLARMSDTVADYERASGQGSLAASGLRDVVTAVQQAAVRTLLLSPGEAPEATLWSTPDGTLVATSRAELLDQGGSDPSEAPAVDVLVRAVAAQAGEVELVDGVDGVLPQGLGALLRFDARPDGAGGRDG